MHKYLTRHLLLCSFLFFASSCNAQQPSVEQFKQAFVAQLQKLKPTGFTERTIRFVQVTKGTSKGGYYSFKVTAYVHDYGPGYPANRYYGQTCLGKMDGWKFDLSKDDFGEWIVQGRFTVTDAVCKDNPSEGVAAIPIASVPGTDFEAKAPDVKNKTAQKEKSAKASGNLYVGEYACYGTGGRLLTGMGFRLKPDGRYTDLDESRAGTYIYDAAKATITFKKGFLDGQVGTQVKQTGFQLSNTISAEPWR